MKKERIKKAAMIVLLVGAGALLLLGCRSAPGSAPPPAAALPEPAAPSPPAAPAAPVATVPEPAPVPAPVEAKPASPRPEPAVKGIILDGAGTYTVVKGDTLSGVAAAKYGGSNMYYFPLIRLANEAAVSDPDEIEVGTKLVIPDLQRNINSAGAKEAMREDMLSVANRYQGQGKPRAAARLRSLAARLAK